MVDDSWLGKKNWSVTDLGKFLKMRQSFDFDYTMVVTGTKGVGKSTLALWLAKEVAGPSFSLEHNILLTPDPMKIAQHIEDAGERPIIILDEAIGSLYTENWAEKSQKGLHVYLNQFQRKLGKQAILILLIPSIFDLRGPLLRSSVDAWLHLVSRGAGALMLRSPAPIQDPFMRDALTDRWFDTARWENKYSAVSQYDTEFQKKVYSKMPTFRAFVEFPQLPEELYKQYSEFVDRAKEEIKTSIFEGAEAERAKNERRKRLLERLRKESEG